MLDYYLIYTYQDMSFHLPGNQLYSEGLYNKH